MKRVTRKGRHVRFGQIPLNCPFSGRRAQSPAVIVTGHNTPSWLSHGAPSMPPRKRAQGFDVALYRRGAGRLLAAEVGFAASRTPSWQTPPPKKTKRYHWLCCRSAGTPTPKRLLPPAGEEAVRRSLTDGRGICKAWGTVIFCWCGSQADVGSHPAPNTLSRQTATAPSYRRSLFVACPQGKHPPPKASSPSGGGSWHVVPDGRGICKALETVIFCPQQGKKEPFGSLTLPYKKPYVRLMPGVYGFGC